MPAIDLLVFVGLCLAAIAAVAGSMLGAGRIRGGRDDDDDRVVRLPSQREIAALPERLRAPASALVDRVRLGLRLIEAAGGDRAPIDDAVRTIRTIASRHANEVLVRYRALPPGLRVDVADATPEELALEQITTLTRSADRAITALAQRHADALVEHGLFLEERFAGDGFVRDRVERRLGGLPPASPGSQEEPR